jgi:hypothetical protein
VALRLRIPVAAWRTVRPPEGGRGQMYIGVGGLIIIIIILVLLFGRR